MTRKKAMTILLIFATIVSMIYATGSGGYVLGIVDTFVNQIALLLAVVFECIIFAWIFKAEKLLDFLNRNSKSIKLGKTWLIIVKYILPIVLSIVWIGGMIDILSTANFETIIFIIGLTILLLGSTALLTLLPAKSPDWNETEERY